MIKHIKRLRFSIKINLVLAILLVVHSAIGQKRLQIDTLFLSKSSKQIKKEILNSYKNDTISIDDNCYYGIIDGEKVALSCFDVEWNLKWVGDINKDGEDDIILKVTDEGEGGGGTAFDYQYLVIYFKNSVIFKKDTIYGGAKFSRGNIAIDSISHNMIFASLDEASINDVSFDDSAIFNKPKIGLQFVYKEGILVSDTFLNCPLKGTDRRIFKSKLSNVIRRLDINEIYEEEQVETYNVNNNKTIRANNTGCQNVKMNFVFTVTYFKNWVIDSLYYKKEWLNNVEFLKNNTLFEELFTEIYKDIEKDGPDLKTGILLPNGWRYSLFIQDYKYNNISCFCLDLLGK